MKKKVPGWLAFCVVVVVAGLVLAVGDSVVGGIIEKEEAQLANEARYAVFANADDFELVSDDSAPVDNCYKALLNGKTVGYVSQITVQGFESKIEILIGMDMDGVITGLTVGGPNFNETEGLGAKTRDPEFTEQFIGLSNMLVLNEDVDTVTGASTSSGAIVGGVNIAMEYMYSLASLEFAKKADKEPEPTPTPEPTKEPDATEEPGNQTGEAIYGAGSYTAAGMGIGGKVPVTVTFSENAILSIEVGENGETQGIGSVAIDKLPDRIIEAQSTDVKGISGATLTSDAIKNAVADCIEQAMAAAGSAGANANGIVDGVYEGTGTGIGGKVPVTVTFEGGLIAAIEVGANGETQGIGSVAIDKLPGRIIEAQSIGVKSISGATLTSDAIKNAVAACIEQAGGNLEDWQ